MNEYVLKYLSELGYKDVSTDYYKYIENWKNYWLNKADYINYKDFYGKDRKMYTLGMGKTVCEDWASTLWSEEDEITSTDNKVDDTVYQISEDYDLKNRIPESIENACWSGTCGAIQRITNAIIGENGTISANEKTKKELILVNALNIIPLRVVHNKIVDVAFVSETMVDGKVCFYVETHILKENGYEITNVYIDEKTGKEVIREDIVKTINTGSDKAWFSLLMPPKVNPVKNNMGLGFSIYGNALDQIKGCDIAYNNFVMDLYLGGKKIIYNKKLVRYGERKVKDKEGNETIEQYPIYPDDITKQQFMEVGDGITGENDKELIHEYNPDLRTEDNEKAIQISLNTFSPKVMLGSKFYDFRNGKIVTATEYVGDRQDFVKNAKKFRNRLNEYIESIVRTSLYIDKAIFGINEIDEEAEILIGTTDGFMVDQETEREQARQDLSMGVISLVEYRMKVFHESEEEATKAVQKINAQYEVKEVSEEE